MGVRESGVRRFKREALREGAPVHGNAVNLVVAREADEQLKTPRGAIQHR